MNNKIDDSILDALLKEAIKVADIPEDEYDNWSAEHSTDLIEKVLNEVDSFSLDEGIKFDYNKMQTGDIYLVSGFVNGYDNYINNKEHRILLVTMIPANKRENQEYLGFSFSSNTAQATVNNYKRQKAILIDNYDTILAPGSEWSNIPVVLDLNRLITFKIGDLASGNHSYLGHVTDEFMQFVNDVITKKRTENLVWNEETRKEYGVS